VNGQSLSNPPHMTLVESAPGWSGIGMGADGKFRIDGSALKAGYKCSTAATLRYGWGLTAKAEKAALLAGTAFHRAAEYHLNGAAVGQSLAAFDGVYQTWAQVNVAADDKLAWQNTRLITQKWIEAHPIVDATTGEVKGWPFRLQVVEVPFEVPLTTVDGVEVLFVGRMDVVGEYLGGYVVVDHKTTGFINSMWTDQWGMDGQVTGYIWAARQLLRDKPVIGAFINGVQFSKLPNDGARKCKDHGVKYAECGPMHAKWEVVGLLERNAVMVENWLAEAVPMAEGLYRLWAQAGSNMEVLPQLQMEGMFTGECRWCEFRKGVSEVGRRPGVARAGLEFSPWNPLEG